MRIGSAATRRGAGFALACVVNAAFLCLLIYGREDRRAPPVDETVPLAMIWLSEPEPPRAPEELPPPVAPRSPEPTAVEPLPPDLAAPRVSTAITLPPEQAVPRVDWYAEGTRVARSVVIDTPAARPQPSPDAEARVLVLPDDAGEPHRNGDVERREGGELITWISERCYYSNRSTESLTGGPPTLKLPTCKVRGRSARDSEASADALEEAAKPEYLEAAPVRP